MDLDTGLGGLVRYSCEGGCGGENLFAVTPNEGTVRVARTLDADEGGGGGRVSLVVVATDGGEKPLIASATVVITSECCPKNYIFITVDALVTQRRHFTLALQLTHDK